MTDSEVHQLRLIITPWGSGHTTVDVVVRGYYGPPVWRRNVGHLDLAVYPEELRGLNTRDILKLLAEAPAH